MSYESNGIETVKLRKADVLDALEENREAHQGIYEEALAGYKELALAQLKKHIKDVERGAMQVISIVLPAPVNQTKDYERIIKMLELDVRDEIELTQAEFAMYVMDDWAWKRQFLTSNSTYSTRAASSLGG